MLGKRKENKEGRQERREGGLRNTYIYMYMDIYMHTKNYDLKKCLRGFVK